MNRLVFRSRQGDSRVPLAARPRSESAGGGNNVSGSDAPGLPLDELQEGDIVLFKGKRFDSKVIAAMGGGVSHCGQMIMLDKQLWLAEAVSVRGSSILLHHEDPRAPASPDAQVQMQMMTKGCVSASALTEVIPFYTHSEVLRPTPSLSPKELATMRNEFLRIEGCAYDHSHLRLVGAVLPTTLLSPQREKFFCSSLTPHLFRTAGRLREGQTGKEKRRFKSGMYLPCSLRNAIAHRNLGALQGTAPFPSSDAG